jgi:hypothetical protein
MSKLFRFPLLVFLLLLSAPTASVWAQSRPAATGASYQYLQMTTIESIVAGGIGRSRLLFSPDFKGTKEAQMENLFSLTGINTKNV